MELGRAIGLGWHKRIVVKPLGKWPLEWKRRRWLWISSNAFLYYMHSWTPGFH